MLKRLALSLVFVPVGVLAHDDHNYRCTSGDAVRRIEVEHAAGSPVPCSVNYIKDTEAAGASEEIYNAQSEDGYCEARAAEFAERLEGLGWACEVAALPPAEGAAAPPAQ